MSFKPAAIVKIALCVAFFFTPCKTILAQTGSISPYSRYGIGDINPEGFSHQRGMGGIGAAVSSPNNINFINPAIHLVGLLMVNPPLQY